MYPSRNHPVFIRERNLYINPIHNTACKRHFTCGQLKCPREMPEKFSCYTEPFRYQPDSGVQVRDAWYIKGKEKLNRINPNGSWLAIIALLIIFSFLAYMLGIFYKFYSHP
ncbi:Uncharacterised protein [uncultured archaeon]|nr:Uncharacterised protein [uncultured archaeon]